MALSMVFSTNAFATPINLTDTPADAIVLQVIIIFIILLIEVIFFFLILIIPMFYFNIKFKGNSSPTLPAKAAFNDMSWADIATVSEAGKAPEYFNVGDEKELTIGSETYHVQILGFAHDDKSDGTGKAGITVGLKEMMTTTHVMNSSGSNAGGWENSEMRTYVNGNVYDNLSQEVKDVIKPVNKLTSEGNKSTNITTTSDKLFLLSEVEIFGSTTYSASGEGSQYQYFADGGSKIKYKSGSSSCWWERSPRVSCTGSFCYVINGGSANFNFADGTSGVVFGFSI